MRFEKLDLNLLVVLDSLLTTRSVNRSAEKLFLSQPATSLSLRRLRDFFADELLQSVGKTQVLTPLAAELVKPVRDVLLQVQAITRARPTFDPASSVRRFKIESSDYVISVLLSGVVRRAANLAPLMTFDLRTRGPQTSEHLEGGAIDLLISPEFAVVPGHPSEPLFEDGFSCLVCSDRYHEGHVLSADQYFAGAHVGVEWGGGRLLTYDARLIATGKRERRQDVIAPTFTLVPELLVGTSRIATVPTRLACQMALRFPLRVLGCPVEIPQFVEKVQWNRFQERDPAIVWLRSLLREAAQSLPPALQNAAPQSRPARRKAAGGRH